MISDLIHVDISQSVVRRANSGMDQREHNLGTFIDFAKQMKTANEPLR